MPKRDQTYRRHRHNVGQLALDGVIARHRGHWRQNRYGATARLKVDDEIVCFFKPFGFMNESGRMLLPMLTRHNIAPRQLCVWHDEIDLPLGDARLKRGGGHNGHNGLRDIDACIGRDYFRARIGVGRPPPSHNKEGKAKQVSTHVLSDFSAEEIHVLDAVIEQLAKRLEPMVRTIAMEENARALSFSLPSSDLHSSPLHPSPLHTE